MQPKVAVLGTLRFPPQHLVELRPHLKALVDATYRLDGCIAYDVAEDPFDPGLLRFAELWPDYATLERHLRAEHLEPWRSAAKRLGLIEREFTAYDVTGSKPV